MREPRTLGVTKVQGKQSRKRELRPCPTLQNVDI